MGWNRTESSGSKNAHTITRLTFVLPVPPPVAKLNPSVDTSDAQENYYIKTYPLSNCVSYWMNSMYGVTVNKTNYSAVQNAIIVASAKVMLAEKQPMQSQYEIILREYKKNVDDLRDDGVISEEDKQILTSKIVKGKKEIDGEICAQSSRRSKRRF